MGPLGVPPMSTPTPSQFCLTCHFSPLRVPLCTLWCSWGLCVYSLLCLSELFPALCLGNSYLSLKTLSYLPEKLLSHILLPLLVFGTDGLWGHLLLSLARCFHLDPSLYPQSLGAYRVLGRANFMSLMRVPGKPSEAR